MHISVPLTKWKTILQKHNLNEPSKWLLWINSIHLSIWISSMFSTIIFGHLCQSKNAIVYIEILCVYIKTEKLLPFVCTKSSCHVKKSYRRVCTSFMVGLEVQEDTKVLIVQCCLLPNMPLAWIVYTTKYCRLLANRNIGFIRNFFLKYYK